MLYAFDKHVVPAAAGPSSSSASSPQLKPAENSQSQKSVASCPVFSSWTTPAQHQRIET